jgi:hypothetical protein
MLIKKQKINTSKKLLSSYLLIYIYIGFDLPSFDLQVASTRIQLLNNSRSLVFFLILLFSFLTMMNLTRNNLKTIYCMSRASYNA